MDLPASTPSGSAPAQAARRWRVALPRESRTSSTARGLFLVALSLSLYLISFAGMFLSPWWPLRLLALAVNPVVIGMLFVIGHDACHNSLTAVGWLNRVIGRVVFLPAYHPFTAWAHAHNTMHHGWTNFKGRHPDFPPFTKEEFDRLPAWRRLVERIYRTPLGVGLYYTVDFWLKHLIFPNRERRSPYRLAFQLDRLLVLAFLLAQGGLAWRLAGPLFEGHVGRALYAGVAVATPFLLWIWFMGFVSFLQHTHPRMAWYDDETEWSFYHVQLRSTAHVVFPWPIERILHNIMDHPAHHLDTQIPPYKLPRSQKALEEAAPEHAVVIRWTPADYLRTCAACKLYDFDRHCWTDFAGAATTPCNLPGLHAEEGCPPAKPGRGRIVKAEATSHPRFVSSFRSFAASASFAAWRRNPSVTTGNSSGASFFSR
jgi:omega-6 fatty acid desaturase (delta-12 desaturase)